MPDTAKIAAFDATSLERDYAFLDDCPAELLPDVVTLPLGSLSERVAGVRRWRDALLGGYLPPADTWPPPEVAAPVRLALEEMGVARFCKDQPDLVDALMKDILAAFVRRTDFVRSEVAERLRELETLERIRQQEAEVARRRKRSKRSGYVDLTTFRALWDRSRLEQQAARDVAARSRQPDTALLATWGDRVRAWAEIADVFGDLGEMLGRGWDLARGVLRSAGWLDLLRLRKLVEQLPQLREIVRALGRLHMSDREPSVAERILVAVRRLEEERLEIRIPDLPSETRGVERSGEIARMLPVEASMLGHPKLRLLWHARRAERALLTYRVEGVHVERLQVEREVTEETTGRRPRPERGPILAVIDTSGSMHGLPETVAKALLLEAMRTAHEEKRRCYVYAYGGPGEVIEQELDVSADGIGRLLAFLSHSFGGGTDIGAMSAVVTRLKQETWKKADVILVSDGEWPAPAAIVAAVDEAKENGTRFHGVQIGNTGRTGMHCICDPVHLFSDWAALGGWR